MHAELPLFNRLAIALAGLLGAAGVAAAAGAAHGGDSPLLQPLALIAMTQAPAVLVLGFRTPLGLVSRIATALIGFGALAFVMELGTHDLLGVNPLPFLAPAGGSAMIAGWAAIFFRALVPPKS